MAPRRPPFQDYQSSFLSLMRQYVNKKEHSNKMCCSQILADDFPTHFLKYSLKRLGYLTTRLRDELKTSKLTGPYSWRAISVTGMLSIALWHQLAESNTLRFSLVSCTAIGLIHTGCPLGSPVDNESIYLI